MTGPRVSRRALLGAAAAGTATGLGGCARGPRPVRVVVVWSGDELARFREALRGYHARSVEVISVRNDMDAFLRARHSTANQPDVAIVPYTGLIAEYAREGWLADLGFLGGRFRPGWHEPLTAGGVLSGAWVKAAHKSLFWYPPGAIADEALPRDWNGFVDLIGRLARSGGPAPLAIGAADGWVLTDWFENVLASLAGGDDTYRALVAGGTDGTGAPAWEAPVRATLRRLAEVWSVPHAFPGGGRRALVTQHEESVSQVFDQGRATMVFEGDFVVAVARRFRPQRPLARFRFPPVTAGAGRLLAAGDAAVVFSGSTDGLKLVDWLTGPDHPFQGWLSHGGYLSPQLDAPDPGRDRSGGLTTALTEELRQATDARTLRFDLSDRLPGPLGGPDGLGLWKILQDFFAAVTAADPDVHRAIDRAVRQLNNAATAQRREGP
ncbi:ABC transporter substrate-binding protein [Planosporangium sp. 12N6]|uniref:ABC transporter substrate-binding protein n=1 Tax=Planosporangium spinosum TaxID=3402278 RepID=UPI003CF38FEB